MNKSHYHAWPILESSFQVLHKDLENLIATLLFLSIYRVWQTDGILNCHNLTASDRRTCAARTPDAKTSWGSSVLFSHVRDRP